MDPNWLKPNVFIVQNGKLVPRPNTPQNKKNYRYIHYDPIGNPCPEDYFRQTISRLQKENHDLQKQIKKILEDQATRVVLNAQGHDVSLIKDYQDQINALKAELARKEKELQEKNQKLLLKDKQILEISNQNSRLHLRINSVIKQIQSLNKIMSKKDQQIMNKKQQIEQYCKTLEKFAVKDKEQQRTNFSENHLMTPKIQQKFEDESDQFNSVQCNSLSDRNHIHLDRRYMTPNIQSFNVDHRNQYLNRTQDYRTFEQGALKSPIARKQEPAYQDKNNNDGKQIIDSFKSSLWSNSVTQINKSQIHRS